MNILELFRQNKQVAGCGCVLPGNTDCVVPQAPPNIAPVMSPPYSAGIGKGTSVVGTAAPLSSSPDAPPQNTPPMPIPGAPNLCGDAGSFTELPIGADRCTNRDVYAAPKSAVHICGQVPTISRQCGDNPGPVPAVGTFIPRICGVKPPPITWAAPNAKSSPWRFVLTFIAIGLGLWFVLSIRKEV